MRLHPVVILAAALPLLALPYQTLGAGNVLLPPSDSAPDLGLAPKEEQPAAPTVEKPGDKLPAILPQTKIPETPAALAAKPSINVLTMPADPNALPSISVLPTMNSTATTGFSTPVSPGAAATLAMPTKVIQVPDPSVPMSVPGAPKGYQAAQPPYVLGATLSDKSVLRANDVNLVTSYLGIPADKVAALCKPSVQAMLSTDKGAYVINTGVTGRGETHYDGRIASIMGTVQALCDKVPLPENKGYIIEFNDKYAVPLGNIYCQSLPAGKTIKEVVLLYDGNGNGECKFP